MTKRILRTSAFLIALAGALSQHAHADSSELLVAPPYHFVTLSADGATLAAYQDFGEDNRKVMLIDTRSGDIDAVPFSDGKAGQAEIEGIDWIGSGHLAVSAKVDGDTTRLYTYELDSETSQARAKTGKTHVLKPIPGTTRFLALEETEQGDRRVWRVLEYDAATSATPEIRYTHEGNTFECVADPSGTLRLVKRADDSTQQIHWYAWDPASRQERKLEALPTWAKVHGVVSQSSEAVFAAHLNSQYPSIYAFDIEADAVKQTLADNPMYSLQTYAESVFDPKSGKLLGLHLNLLTRESRWSDPEFARIQAALDAELQGSSNRIVSWSEDKKHIIVKRYVPNFPIPFLYYNVESGASKPLLLNGPSLKPDELSNTQLFKYQNRSGSELSAVLTAPVLEEMTKLPLIVWIRDGIWQDLDRAEWHPIANYFAAEGFAVLRINYTGTEGLLGDGSSDRDSREEVLKTFSDIEDGVRALVDAGLVHPAKVCIGGEGAAAWASAYAPIASPGTYAGVISINGLYDLTEYREASKGENEMNGGTNLNFANANSALSAADIQALSVPQNLTTYPEFVLLTSGKWSAPKYKSHVADFAKALRKAKVKVKVHTDDWWGADLKGYKKIKALERSSSLLKSDLK